MKHSDVSLKKLNELIVINCILLFYLFVYIAGALCDSRPCQNNGLCVSLFEDLNYACVCVPGFEGRNCETGM